jgi:hypothetical protein
MVMEENEQPPAPTTEASAPQGVERPLWVLSREDQRLFVITFVGGVASIVVGACVIGGAIALVRGIKATHFSLVVLIGFTAVYTVAVVSSFYDRRRLARIGLRLPRSRVVLIAQLLLYVVFSVLLLAWIGFAAGIH